MANWAKQVYFLCGVCQATKAARRSATAQYAQATREAVHGTGIATSTEGGDSHDLDIVIMEAPYKNSPPSAYGIFKASDWHIVKGFADMAWPHCEERAALGKDPLGG
jgi:hypothetical protein